MCLTIVYMCQVIFLSRFILLTLIKEQNETTWPCLRLWLCLDWTMVLSCGTPTWPNTLTWLWKLNGLSQDISLLCKTCHIQRDLLFWSCILSSVEERYTLSFTYGTFWSTKFQTSLLLYVLEHLIVEEEYVLHLTLVLEDWEHWLIIALDGVPSVCFTNYLWSYVIQLMFCL